MHERYIVHGDIATRDGPWVPAHASQALRAFLGRCFELDPGRRASAKALLTDPFLAQSPGPAAGAEL